MTVLHTHWCSRWPYCPPPCRCSHQTLWCGAGVAGAWSVQLHLSSLCGAQCCCMWSNTLTHTQPPVPESVTLLSVTETREELSTSCLCSVQLWTVSWGMNEGGFLLITAFLCVSWRSTHFLLCVSRVVNNNQTNNSQKQTFSRCNLSPVMLVTDEPALSYFLYSSTLNTSSLLRGSLTFCLVCVGVVHSYRKINHSGLTAVIFIRWQFEKFRLCV